MIEQHDLEKFGRNGSDLTEQQCINRWERTKYWIENDVPDPERGSNHGFPTLNKEEKIAHCNMMIEKIKNEGL